MKWAIVEVKATGRGLAYVPVPDGLDEADLPAFVASAAHVILAARGLRAPRLPVWQVPAHVLYAEGSWSRIERAVEAESVEAARRAAAQLGFEGPRTVERVFWGTPVLKRGE